MIFKKPRARQSRGDETYGCCVKKMAEDRERLISENTEMKKELEEKQSRISLLEKAVEGLERQRSRLQHKLVEQEAKTIAKFHELEDQCIAYAAENERLAKQNAGTASENNDSSGVSR